ncbi:MAG: hypothetical protein GY725_18405 [bacterium]|nr:hypothetical protein [bacterium]
MNELNSVFSPNGKEFYYAVDVGIDWVIMVSRERGGVWSEPEVASFTRSSSGVDLCISADSRRLLFCSYRSRSGGSEPENDLDIWYVDRTETDSWSEPVNLASVNSETNEFYPSLTTDGTLYFLSRRAGGIGGSDIYRSTQVDGHYTEPENLGPVLNTPANEGDALIAPDESFIVFNSRGHEQGPGEGRLFISFRGHEGSWSPPRNLGQVMEADPSDFCPTLSPDGKYFFFSSARPRLEDSADRITWASLYQAQSRPENGSTDIYWIDARFIEEMRLPTR